MISSWGLTLPVRPEACRWQQWWKRGDLCYSICSLDSLLLLLSSLFLPCSVSDINRHTMTWSISSIKHWSPPCIAVCLNQSKCIHNSGHVNEQIRLGSLGQAAEVPDLICLTWDVGFTWLLHCFLQYILFMCCVQQVTTWNEHDDSLRFLLLARRSASC